VSAISGFWEPVGRFIGSSGSIIMPKKTKQALLTFAKLQFVKNGSFTGSVKSDHQDSHLLLAELLM
jgi:hypothetical protein